MYRIDNIINEEEIVPALKAYYQYFRNLDGEFISFLRLRHQVEYSMNPIKKVNQKDYNLQSSIKTITQINNDPNILVLKTYDENSNLNSLTRMIIHKSDHLLVPDIVFINENGKCISNYTEIIEGVEESARRLEVPNICFEIMTEEVQKDLGITLFSRGYTLSPEVLSKYPYRTTLFEKTLELTKEDNYGRHLINKQTSPDNQ